MRTVRVRPNIIALIVLLIAVTAIVSPVHSFISTRLTELKADALDQIEAELGRRVSYDRISPSIFRRFDIRGLTVHGSEDESEVLLSVSRVRVYYSLADLISGGSRNPLRRISIENTRVRYDSDADRELYEFVRELADSRTTQSERELAFTLSGRNLSLEVVHEGHEYRLEDLFFDADLAGSSRFRAGARFTLQEFGEPFGLSGLGAAEAEFAVEGRFDDEFSLADVTLQLPYLGTDHFVLRDQAFAVSLGDQSVVARKLQDREPVDLTVSYDLETRELAGSFLAEQYRPADSVRLRGLGSEFDAWMQTVVSGEGHLNWRLDGELDYRVAMQAELPAEGDHLRLSAVMRGDRERVDFDRVIAISETGSAIFEGYVTLADNAPNGRLVLNEFSYGDSRRVNGALDLSGADGRYHLSSRYLEYGGFEFYNLDAGLGLENGRLAYSVSSDLEFFGDSAVSAEGTLALGTDGPQGTVHADLQNVPLERPYAAWQAFSGADEARDAPQALGRYILDSRVSLEFNDTGLQVAAPFVSLYDRDDRDNFATFSVRSDGLEYHLENIMVGFADQQGSGTVTARLDDRDRVRFESDLLFGGVAYELAGLVDPAGRVVASGSYGLDFNASFGEGRNFVFALRADELPVPIGAHELAASLDLNGAFAARDDWELLVNRARLTEMPFLQGDEVAIEFGGRFNPSAGRLQQIVYEDRFSRLSGSGDLEYGFASPFTADAAFSLTSDSGEERYEASLEYLDGEISGRAMVENASLRRLGVQPVRGGVNAELIVSGSPTSPQITGRFESVEARFNNDPFQTRGVFEYREAMVGVREINLQYLSNELTDVEGSMNLETGRLALDSRFEQFGRPDALEVSVRLRAGFEPHEDEPLRLGELADRDASAEITVFSDALAEDDGRWDFRVSRSEGRTVLQGAPENSVNAYLDADGAFQLRLSAPLPVMLTASGVYEDGEVEADLTRVSVHADRMSDLLSFRRFAIHGGRVSGSIRVVGPINDPDFFGTLTAEDARVWVEYVADEITAERFYVVLQEKALVINPFRAKAGRGEVEADGRLLLGRWTPEEYEFEFRTLDEHGVNIAHAFDSLQIDGFGTGTFTISGTPQLTNLGGSVTARSTTITLGPEQEPEPQGRDHDVVVDLEITSGRGVEFYWPTRNFPILRSFARAGETIYFEHSGLDGSFALRGDVGIQGGEIFYFDRSFYIREGSITFDETQDQFDPRLSARAEIREIAERGPVTLYLVADETRLSEFTPRFESDPLLSEQEIAELLGRQVFTQTAGDIAALSSAVLLTGDVVTQFGAMRTFESTVRDFLRLDLLSVRTQVFQNIVRGAVGEEQPEGEPIDTTGPSLGEYFDNTSVFLGKYLGTDLFLELLVRVQAADRRDPEVQELGGLSVDSELTLEFQTPFFNLDWNFFPRNPQELFVTDSTFTFSWGFSY